MLNNILFLEEEKETSPAETGDKTAPVKVEETEDPKKKLDNGADNSAASG